MPVQRRWLIAGGAAAVIGVVIFGFWFAVIRGDAPPPVSLERAAESLATPTATATDADAGGTPTVAGSEEPAAAPGLEGAWTVSAEGESFVGYRVKQTVVGVDAPTRVGRTPAVTATFEASGEQIAALSLEADLLQLTSGDERRDAIFADLLETDLFPTASFELSSAVPIDEVIDVAEGASFAARLTLHGVTNDVTLSLEGSTEGSLIILVGSTEIAFVDFGIDRPTVLSVLSIEDRATLELQLVLERE